MERNGTMWTETSWSCHLCCPCESNVSFTVTASIDIDIELNPLFGYANNGYGFGSHGDRDGFGFIITVPMELDSKLIGGLKERLNLNTNAT